MRAFASFVAEMRLMEMMYDTKCQKQTFAVCSRDANQVNIRFPTPERSPAQHNTTQQRPHYTLLATPKQFCDTHKKWHSRKKQEKIRVRKSEP